MGTFTLATDDPVLHDFAAEVDGDDPIEILGAGTRADVGGPVRADARPVTAPAGIVEHRPEEMLVTVRAGTTVAELHAELAAKGQRTGLPERGGTVGGAVAVGQNCLERLGRGSVRDAVLQVRFVTADGKLTTGGGPVVKNVSGFNVPKLMTGSLGTLGVIAEVILRTNPIPAASTWRRVSGVDPVELHARLLRPSCVLWDGDTTWVHLEGHPGDVDHELGVIDALGPRAAAEVDGPPDLPAHRWALKPSIAVQPQKCSLPGPFVVSIGVGTSWADTPQPARVRDHGALEVAKRMKRLFDPTGRLNPGRKPWI